MDQLPLIWRISVHLSGGSASSYLEDQLPHIWRISFLLSGGSASTYLANTQNKAFNSVELSLAKEEE
jgi:hypothetical protein